MLKVPTLVVDVHARIGDTWRTRYRHLVLHDVVWYDYMPYMNFPDWWPVYTPKDKVADWFEAYARLLELDVWTGSRIVQDGDVDQEMGASRWDAEKKRWTLTVERSTVVAGDITVKTRHVLHPKHIIQATGHSGKPYMPDIPGINTFKGDLLRHSSAFPGAGLAAMKASTTDNAVPRTKRAVIVGACNSAHDIAQDYVESGLYASVTLLQRSSTCVFSAQAIPDLLLGVLYSENSPCASVEEADVLAWSMPMAMLKAVHRQVTAEQQRRDGPLLDSLAASGFALDDGPDHCGLWIKYIQRGGGYYIDVGASALVASGRIKVLSGPGANVAAVTPTGLRLADGSEIPADEIVFATGYGNTHGAVAGVIGAEAAKRVGDAWGFDEKGEIRGLWRPGGGGKEQNREGQDGFWLHGGNFAMCRYYSRILALQIKARLEGLVE